jgi:hypothetical protein
MEDNIKNSFGGFSAITDSLLRTDGNNTIGEDNERTIDPEDIKKQMEALDNVKPVSKSSTTKSTKEIVKDDEEELEEDDDSEEELVDEEEEDVDDTDDITEDGNAEKLESKVKGSKKKDSEELDVEEGDLVEAFADLFAEELGWKYEDNKKPKDIKGIIKYMQDIVDTNSEPKYSNDEIKALDEFVKNGGSPREYFKQVYVEDIDPEKLDITKESDQKAIIRTNLKNRGYSEQRIEKLISRYEDTDALEDEAEDSLAEVKEYASTKKEQLLKDQAKVRERQEAEQLTFIKNVEKVIKDTNDIRGIPLSEKKKAALIEYVFKPEKDGMTKYQKEYNSDLKNLLESAYFTMERDTFVQQVQKKATTNAVKNLKLKIRTAGKSTKNASSDDDSSGKVAQVWEMASSFLAKNNNN